MVSDSKSREKASLWFTISSEDDSLEEKSLKKKQLNGLNPHVQLAVIPLQTLHENLAWLLLLLKSSLLFVELSFSVTLCSTMMKGAPVFQAINS